MDKIRIVFNRVEDNTEEVIIIDTNKDDVTIETRNDNMRVTPNTRENLKTLFSVILNLRAEGVQDGWNTALRIGDTLDGPKLNLHAYNNRTGILVTYVTGVSSRREFGHIQYTTINQMVEEFENMCSQTILNKIVLNDMTPEEFRESIIDLERRRNEHVKARKNSTQNMIDRSEKMLKVIENFLR